MQTTLRPGAKQVATHQLITAGFARTRGDLDTLGSTAGISTGLGGAYGSYFSGPGFGNAVVFARVRECT